MNCLSQVMKYADIFDRNVFFRYGNERTHRTALGGMASFGIFSVLLYLLYNFGYDLVNNLNPNLTIQPVYYKENKIRLNETALNFIIIPTFDIDNFHMNYTIDSGLIEIIMEKTTYITQKDGTKIINRTAIPLKKCDYDDFDENIQKVFYQNNLDKGLCLSDKNFELEGQFDSNTFKFLKIYVMECRLVPIEKRSSKECKPQEDLLNLLAKIKLSFYYTYSQIDPNNYKNPFYTLLHSNQIILSTSSYKRSNYFFAPDVISTDDSYVFNDPYKKNKTFTSWVELAEDFSVSGQVGYTFFQAFIRINSRYNLVLRTYKKIPTVLAEAGSLISYLNFYFILLIGYYNENALELSLINHLLSYDNIDNLEKSFSLKKFNDSENNNFFETMKKRRDSQNLTVKMNLSRPNMIHKKFSIHYNGNKKSERFSFWKFCKNKFKINSKKFDLMTKMKMLVEQFLDVRNFMVLNEEFLILKDLTNMTGGSENPNFKMLMTKEKSLENTNYNSGNMNNLKKNNFFEG